MNNENYTKNDLSHYTRNILTSNVIPIAFRVAVYNITFQQYIFLAIKKDKEMPRRLKGIMKRLNYSKQEDQTLFTVLEIYF